MLSSCWSEINSSSTSETVYRKYWATLQRCLQSVILVHCEWITTLSPDSALFQIALPLTLGIFGLLSKSKKSKVQLFYSAPES